MMWQGRELNENSWLWHVGFGKVVAATENGLRHIQMVPGTYVYRWPTTEELIKHFGEQHDVQGS